MEGKRFSHFLTSPSSRHSVLPTSPPHDIPPSPSLSHSHPLYLDAPIHDDGQPGSLRSFRSLDVDHAKLQPQRGQLQANAVIDNGGDMLRLAKDVHDVDPFIGIKGARQGVQARTARRPSQTASVGFTGMMR